MSDLEPLDPDLATLIAYETERPGIPGDAAARLANRLGAAIPGFAPTIATTAPSAAAAHAGWLQHPLRLALATFVAGGVIGAGIHARVARAPEPVAAAPVMVAAPAATPPPVAPVVTEVPPAPPAPVATPAPARARPPTAAPGSDTALARERTLIEIARAAMSRGDAADCLRAIDRHVRDFPHGQLVEEREALRVQALAASGHAAEARDHAAHFHRRFPDSLLAPVVDLAVQSIP